MSDRPTKKRVLKAHYEAAHYARERIPFRSNIVPRHVSRQGARIFGEWKQADLYVVYSYGYHWPMYVWDDVERQWYGLDGKYSRSTTSHAGHACPAPAQQIKWVDENTMKNQIATGDIVTRMKRIVLGGTL